ncbi:unnamed protein product, partial [Rotaria sp. Silwood1]
SAFIELAIAAINELSSSSNMSFSLENIQFLSALLLKKNEINEIHTIIVMPYQQFLIYSRCNHSKDCVRTSGISGNDIDTNNDELFHNNKILNEYSLKQWTLHAQGTINTKIDISIQNSLNNINLILNRFKNLEYLIENENEIRKFYSYLSRRGYNYGSYFQGIKSIKRTRSKTLAEICLPSIFLQLNKEQQNDQEKYYLHPVLLDICIHTVLSILPGNDTFVSNSIEKIIYYQQLTPKLMLNENVFIYNSFRMPVRGVTIEENYITDIVIFTSSSIIANISGVNFRQIPSNESIQSQTIFEKLDNYIFNPINNNSLDINQVIQRYCQEKQWRQCHL